MPAPLTLPYAIGVQIQLIREFVRKREELQRDLERARQEFEALKASIEVQIASVRNVELAQQQALDVMRAEQGVGTAMEERVLNG